MVHAEHEVVVGRSAADVYSYLADGMNNPSWRHGVRDLVLRSGEPAAVGAVYGQTMAGPGGRAIAGDYEITEAVPGERLSFHVVAGPARPTGTYTFTAEDAGTRVKFALDVQPSGMMKLLSPAIARTMRQEVAQLDRLKSVLEAGD
ncbi:SRPBCC family protein [Specibacter cremeus]|uniref:SRPBCC family protein n=1 Tax=Specibacter cremeus TaxID=1629051 RepID=UPI000F7AF925|nr:SRPBCC family protein [Specibacter cremeus]